MSCLGIDTASPFFWVFLSGLFFGAAFSKIIFTPSKNGYKWSIFSFYLSFSIMLALAGVFIPGARNILDIRLFYLFLAVVIISFFSIKYKKAFGIPLLSLFLVIFIISIINFKPWSCFKESTEITKFRLLSRNNNIMKLEFFSQERESVFVSIKGDSFVPLIDYLKFNEYYLFLRERNLYHFNGIKALSEDSSLNIFLFSDQNEDSEKSEKVVSFLGQLPGVDSVRTVISPFKPLLLREYSIVLNKNGTLDFVFIPLLSK